MNPMPHSRHAPLSKRAPSPTDSPSISVRALGVEPRPDAYKTSWSHRDRARMRERDDAARWAICESNAVRAPYQRAQGDQPVLARGANERIRPPPLRGA